MAMTICTECLESVSDTASACPHCGAALRPPVEARAQTARAGVAITTVAALAVCGTLSYLAFQADDWGGGMGWSVGMGVSLAAGAAIIRSIHP